MEIHNFRMTETDGYLELACNALSETVREGEFTIWYRFPADFEEVGVVAEPFLAALLIPCMRQKENLIVRGSVSAKLLNSTSTIMDIVTMWEPTLSRIAIEVDETCESGSTGDQVGCFFSCGADSFYTLFKNMEQHPHDRDSITHFILLRGFDIGLEKEDDPLWEHTLHNAEKVAEETGKQVIPVITNARTHTDMQTSWGRYPPGDLWTSVLHGSLLASVGLCMSRAFRRIMIAATHGYEYLVPTGSHPLLDPLWSTEKTEFIHDGCEATRFQKIAHKITKSPIAMQTLRVCWENRDGNYNCGECEKCLRTMIALDLVGVLAQCETFNRPLSLEILERLTVPRRKQQHFEILLAQADALGRVDLAKAIRRCLAAEKTVSSRIKRELDRFYRRIAGAGEKIPR